MEFLQSVLQLYIDRGGWFLQLVLDHLALSLTAILIAGCAGLALGILISEYRRAAPFVMGVCNVFYTIPSISLLGILIPFLGIGNKTAVTALTIYAIMPMVRNTYAGITAIDPDVVEAARGMGSTRFQILVRVKLPLAFGVILAGLRNMAVMTISVGGIASYIGAGGLGVAIYRGITIYNPAMTFAGSLLIALLALGSDFLLGLAEKHYKKKRRLNLS
ncbi:MAG: ABC transporter permease [Oscillospiraceae bacterium]|nr:ABC transporter permease [Oscillospiraceae bacterium]